MHIASEASFNNSNGQVLNERVGNLGISDKKVFWLFLDMNLCNSFLRFDVPNRIELLKI